MQQLFIQALAHVPGASRGFWGGWCSHWEWGFWLGVAVAIVGAFVLYFALPRAGSYTDALSKK